VRAAYRHGKDRRDLVIDGLAINGCGPGLRPARNDLERFQALFTDCNEAARRRWFPGRRTLFDIDFAQFPLEADDATTMLDTEFDQLARKFKMQFGYD
jgi:hypothetical protein